MTELCARPAHGHSRVSIRLLLRLYANPVFGAFPRSGPPGRTRCLDAQLSTWTLFNQEQSVFQAKREIRLTSPWRFSRERKANLVLLANLQRERTEDRFFKKVLGNRPGKLSFSRTRVQILLDSLRLQLPRFIGAPYADLLNAGRSPIHQKDR